MKIAIFVNSFPNISETFVLNHITGLIDRGHHVDIYSMRRGNAEKVHADVARYRLLERTRYIGIIPKNYIVRVSNAIKLLAKNYQHLDPSVLLKSLNVRKYGRASSSLSLLFEAIPLLRERQYDVIHCEFGSLGPRIAQLRQIDAIRGKLVVSFRGYDATQYLKKRPGVYDELFREADLFLPVSSSLAKVLVEAGCPEEKIRVHHSGIDCSKFAAGERVRKSDEPLRVISVARLFEKKGNRHCPEGCCSAPCRGQAYYLQGDRGRSSPR
jgi:colanic acid/amylovoran biosynthesis glycosyltransferase